MPLQLVQDPEADALLESNPFALLVGMLLDQQIPLEVAFAGPKKIADRMGDVDAREIAEYDQEKFAALCAERPAVHRFPGSMAKRIQALAPPGTPAPPVASTNGVTFDRQPTPEERAPLLAYLRRL